MTNINQAHNLTPPFAEAPTSVNGLKGFEPGSLILGGKECTIYNSRRSSIINGKDIILYETYNSHGIGVNTDANYVHNVSNTFLVFCSNGIFSRSDIVSYFRSDESLKDNIKTLPKQIHKIRNINPISFEWNEKQQTYIGKDIGFSAQQVEKEFPEMVTLRQDKNRSIKYDKFIPILIACIRDNQKRIYKIKEKIKNGKQK